MSISVYLGHYRVISVYIMIPWLTIIEGACSSNYSCSTIAGELKRSFFFDAIKSGRHTKAFDDVTPGKALAFSLLGMSPTVNAFKVGQGLPPGAQQGVAHRAAARRTRPEMGFISRRLLMTLTATSAATGALDLLTDAGPWSKDKLLSEIANGGVEKVAFSGDGQQLFAKDKNGERHVAMISSAQAKDVALALEAKGIPLLARAVSAESLEKTFFVLQVFGKSI